MKQRKKEKKKLKWEYLLLTQNMIFLLTYAYKIVNVNDREHQSHLIILSDIIFTAKVVGYSFHVPGQVLK